MRYLLFPDEERILIRHLHVDLGLRFLASEGKAITGADPAVMIDDEFPYVMSRAEREFFFWCPKIGPVQRLGNSPPPEDAIDAVHLHVNRQACPDDWQDLIDLSRTPVISWRRPQWYREGRNCLIAGRLGAMTAKIKDYPPELRRLYNRVDRWLRKPSTKLNPFEHCRNTPVSEPKNLNTFWVAAWPQAVEWVEQGGELWPWDG